MAITAGIGSDHVDLQAAMDKKVDVVEVSGWEALAKQTRRASYPHFHFVKVQILNVVFPFETIVIG